MGARAAVQIQEVPLERGLRQARPHSEPAESGYRASQRICTGPGRSRAVYDRLAPDPDWHYGTIIPLKRTPDGKDWDFAMPSSARTFLKGILDLLAGVKTGELTTDALESFMTLHTMGSRAFGPLGDPGTLVAGGNRRSLPPPKAMDKQSEKFEQAVERFH